MFAEVSSDVLSPTAKNRPASQGGMVRIQRFENLKNSNGKVHEEVRRDDDPTLP
jgi:hypothetical protein